MSSDTHQPKYCYLPDEDEIVEYDVMAHDHESIEEYLGDGCEFIGYGHWVGTTALGEVSFDNNVYAFFVRGQ